ncbi:MAG: primosomal protein N' [Chloroflexi bacterium]|nr:primosomal protein N' [Chloroflexota bacterium]
MGYAEVCVNSPIARRRTFSYSIPPSLKIEAGQAVWVPFGARVLQGVVLQLTDSPAVEETKGIAGIIDVHPVLSPRQVDLAYWLSDYYQAPLYDTVALMLPPGFDRQAQTFLSPKIPDDFDSSRLSPEEERTLKMVQGRDKTSLKALEKKLGKGKAQNLANRLVRRGLLLKTHDLEPVRVKPKTTLYVSMAVSLAKAREASAGLRLKRARKQAAVLDFIAGQSKPMTLAEVRQQTGCTGMQINALVHEGLVAMQPVVVRHDPLAHHTTVPSFPLPLTPAQEAALKTLASGLPKSAGKGASRVFLLHGVTGSGKTEIYLQALAEAVRRGEKGIVLVPEIALTPQTIERFASRFPGKVAVIHSRLSPGERFDEWQRIRDGEFDVVIGARSALFAPQPDLGLIVIDEEHEWNYKQADQSPHYHARTVAIKLAELSGAAVVLGSATPDVETYYRAQKADYQLVELPERVTPFANSPLPRVDVVDMRDELKAGNTGLFSRPLFRAIGAALDSGEQAILFLNRRGASTFVQCRRCGLVLRCRRCDVALTYHSSQDALVCHQCNYRAPAPRVCPRCQNRRIKFLGTGTEKLEEETALAFPRARLLRWDSDTTRTKGSHEAILDSFRRHEADILIGTQMVSKGLDLPQVTLVGVINADTGLNLPDFRAGERTFQLLTQVAGRAGRGPRGGQVIIQTYNPEHYAIKAAAKHDYQLFYEKESAFRRQFNEPPFCRMAALTYSATNDQRCREEAERMKHMLLQEMESRGVSNIDVLGPAPAFISRRRGRYRWQLFLRGDDPASLLARVPIPQGWTIDVDPLGLS